MSCFSFCKKRHIEPIIVLIIGLDYAGKSSIVLRLKNEPGIPLPSGWGFSVENMQFNILPQAFTKKPSRFRILRSRKSIVPIKIYDVGGDAKIRGIWKNYIAEAHAVVYVVDSSDKSRFEESKTALHQIYNDPRLYGKPLLIMSNKKDLATTLTPEALFDQLALISLFPKANAYSNEYNEALPFRIQECTSSYLDDSNEPVDGRIKAGFRWLLDSVRHHRTGLDARVKQNIQAEKLAKAVKKGQVTPGF